MRVGLILLRGGRRVPTQRTKGPSSREHRAWVGADPARQEPALRRGPPRHRSSGGLGGRDGRVEGNPCGSRGQHRQRERRRALVPALVSRGSGRPVLGAGGSAARERRERVLPRGGPDLRDRGHRGVDRGDRRLARLRRRPREEPVGTVAARARDRARGGRSTRSSRAERGRTSSCGRTGACCSRRTTPPRSIRATTGSASARGTRRSGSLGCACTVWTSQAERIPDANRLTC